jgi:hypothetical protein
VIQADRQPPEQTTLELRWGDSITNPTPEQLQSALDQLDAEDEEHPDTWLTAEFDDSAWTISAFGSGLTILTIRDTTTEPEQYQEYELVDISRAEVLEMWQNLQRGRISEIARRQWPLRP